MKNIKNYSLSLLLAVGCVIAGRACALEPCRDPDAYAVAVNKIIDNAVGRPAELALTAFPSFKAEYGVRIIGRDIYFVQLNPSFWASSVVADGPGSYHHDFGRARVSTSIQKASLSADLALRVRQKYASALSALKVSKSGGLDGTTYRFALRTFGCGETWSPEPVSLDGQLVDLTELLAKHAQRSYLLPMSLSEEKILRALSREQ
jgi:hypothetical protein